jgi:sarcosine oxidase delta subunit
MSKVKAVKEIPMVVVEFAEFCDFDFIAPSSMYIRNASGDYVYFKTKDRQLAQKQVDEIYGVGRYFIVGTKTLTAKGALTCMGTATRTRPSSRQPK